MTLDQLVKLAPVIRFRLPEGVTLDDLGALPELVRQLQTRVTQLEGLLKPDDGQMLDTNEAAALLSMRPQAVRQAAWRGSIPSVRIGRRLRFRRSELLALR